MNRKFSDLFPTPRFMSMLSAGLIVSDDAVRCIELTKKYGKLEIKFYAEKILSPGIVESGNIKKMELLRDVLSEIKNEFNLDMVNMALPEEGSYLFRLNLPKMKRSEIRSAIELQLEEHVPLPPAEVLFDYEILGEKNGGFAVSVSAISATTVEDYEEVLEKSGLRAISFETESEATARAVVERNDPNTSMVVYVGRTKTCVCVIQDGNVLFSSSVNIGGDLFANALQKDRGITHEEALRILDVQGIGQIGDNNELFSTLLPSLSALKDEIGRRVVYWNTRKDDNEKENKKIDIMYICGPTANLSGIDDYLSYGVENKVKRANPWVNVTSFADYVPSLPHKDSLAYATAIGLALRNFDEENNVSIDL
jgi:type IV pilus assembly protein PilM